MATDKGKATPAPAKAAETVYSLDEIAAAAARFGAHDYAIRAAFKLAGKSEATEAEARRIVSEYRGRKING